jgi:hypothetical protein
VEVLIVLLGIGIAVVMFAQASNTTTVTKTIDARTYVSDAETYYILFVGRGDSITGHAYVVWRDKPGPGPVPLRDEIYGFFPKDRSLPGEASSAAPVAGELLHNTEDLSHAKEILQVQVDASQWQKSEKARETYLASPPYMMGANDCVNFLQDIGKAFDLAMPPRDALNAKPESYVTDLMTNIDKDYDLQLDNGNSYHGQSIVRGPNYTKQIWAFGKGTYRTRTGTEITGNFRYGVLDGDGKYSKANGDGYQGKFASGEPTYGTWTYSNGSYNGPAKIPTGGHATIHISMPNGSSYDGEVDDHRQLDGQGSFKDGGSQTTFSGTFSHGQYAAGNVSVIFSNGARAVVNTAPGISLSGPMTYTAPDGASASGTWTPTGYKVNWPHGDPHHNVSNIGIRETRPKPEVRPPGWIRGDVKLGPEVKD